MLVDIVKKLNENQPETVHWFVGEVRVWYDSLTVDFVRDVIKADKNLYQSLAFSSKNGYKEYLRRAAVIRSSSGLIQKLKEAVIGVKSTDVKEIEVCDYTGQFSIQRKRKQYPVIQQNEPLDDLYLDLCSGPPRLDNGLIHYVTKAVKKGESHFSDYNIDLSHPLVWTAEENSIVGRKDGITGFTPRLNVEIVNPTLYVPLTYMPKEL